MPWMMTLRCAECGHYSVVHRADGHCFACKVVNRVCQK